MSQDTDVIHAGSVDDTDPTHSPTDTPEPPKTRPPHLQTPEETAAAFAGRKNGEHHEQEKGWIQTNWRKLVAGVILLLTTFLTGRWTSGWWASDPDQEIPGWIQNEVGQGIIASAVKTALSQHEFPTPTLPPQGPVQLAEGELEKIVPQVASAVWGQIAEQGKSLEVNGVRGQIFLVPDPADGSVSFQFYPDEDKTASAGE